MRVRAIATVMAILLSSSVAALAEEPRSVPADVSATQVADVTPEDLPPPSDADSPDKLEARAAMDRVDLREAARRAVFDSEAAALLPTLERDDSFSGMWLERSPEYLVHVVVSSDDGASAARRVVSASRDLPIQIDRADHSLVSLRSILGELATVRDEIREGRESEVQRLSQSEGNFDLAIDERANVVELRTPSPSDALVAEMSKKFGDAVVVKQQNVAQPTNCRSEWACDPAMMGGLAIDNPISNGVRECSTAFVVTDGTSTRRVMSAGHCHLPGDNVWNHNGLNAVTANAVWLGGRNDAMTLALLPGFQPSSKVWLPQNAFPGRILGLRSYANTPQFFPLCKQGRTTGFSCGNVGSRIVSPSYVPSAQPNFVQFTACGSIGDSGGAAFDGTDAMGIVSGVVDNSPCNAGSRPGIADDRGEVISGQVIYSPLDLALDDLNVNLTLTDNVPPRSIFAHSCNLGNCQFNGTQSWDPDGGALASYFWDFHNGVTATGAVASYNFLLPGNKTVSLGITDDQGAYGTSTQSFLTL